LTLAGSAPCPCSEILGLRRQGIVFSVVGLALTLLRRCQLEIIDSALAPIAVLHSILGSRAVLILPLGAIGVAALTWLYALDRSNMPRIIPKLMVSIWFSAMSYLLITL
jgi:hypothetical protein